MVIDVMNCRTEAEVEACRLEVLDCTMDNFRANHTMV